MKFERIKNTVFRRIGNYYGSLIDPYHFMGRSAFQDSWILTMKKSGLKPERDLKTTKGVALK